MTLTPHKPLLHVLSGGKSVIIPIWLMRQAGRYLPEYRALRAEKGGFLELVNDHEAAAAVTLQPIDRFGFDDSDRRLLLTVIDKFNGGPVGLSTLAAAVGEETDTVEDVVEPYLLQLGFLRRTPRGRVATEHAYRHLGSSVPGTLPLQG